MECPRFLSNIAAAFVAGLFLRHFFINSEIYQVILFNMVRMNTGLGIFNLLPIPPFGGSHVLENMLPPPAAKRFLYIRRYAPIAFLGMLLLDHYMKLNVLGRLFTYPILKISVLFGGENFLKVLMNYEKLLN